MKNFLLGFAVCIGLVVLCGATLNTAQKENVPFNDVTYHKLQTGQKHLDFDTAISKRYALNMRIDSMVFIPKGELSWAKEHPHVMIMWGMRGE